MGKTYTGIDIGSSRLKFSVCDSSGAIKVLAEVPVPEQMLRDGCIVSPDAMSDFLRTSSKKSKARNKECAIILPAELAFFRRFTVPLMTEEQLRLNLPYEFRDFINQEKDKYFYDYAVAGLVTEKNGTGTELDLVAAATLKATIASYMSILRRAGFKLRIAAPVEFAFSNLIRRYESTHPSDLKREYCIIDLGHTATRIYIYSSANFEVSRVIDLGGEEIDEAIADELNVDKHIAASYKLINRNEVQSLDACRSIYHNIAIEIMRAINFYGFNNPESDLTDAYYCGGGAKIPLFLEEIASTIELKLHSVEELMPVSAKNRDNMLLCPAAFGITQQ